MDKSANEKRPRGRPPHPEGVRRRSNLTLRVRDETKAALERNAAANGRSLSEEAETLLDQALRSPQLLQQAFDLALDRPGAGLLMALVRVMRDVASGAAFVTSGRHGRGDDWVSSPYAFKQISRAIATMLDAVRPEGDVTPPPASVWATAEKLQTWGNYAAQQILAAVVGRTEHYQPQAGDFVNELDDPSMQWVLPVRERLGPVVIGRIKERIAASKDV